MARFGNDTSVTGPNVPLLLETFQGKEALGIPYRYELTLLSDNPNIPVGQVLGQSLTVSIKLHTGKHRFFNGVVTYFAKVGLTMRHARYAAVVVPYLSLFAFTRNCRIFNDPTNFVPDPEIHAPTQNTIQIVTEVLKDRDFSDVVDHTKNNHVGYDRRYCVQYRETDLNFIQRLLEDEGIYYFFKHEADKHTMVLADSPAAHGEVEGYESILYVPKQRRQQPEEEHFWSLTVADSLYPGKFSVLRAYDYTQERPTGPRIGDMLTVPEQPGKKFEDYDYPDGIFWCEDIEAYVRGEAAQVANTMIEVEGNTVGLGVGDLVTLRKPLADIEHVQFGDDTDFTPFWTHNDFNEEYLITAATYSMSINDYETGDAGASDEPFKARFTLLNSQSLFRPARTAHKPRIEGPQTAIIVGPSKDDSDDATRGDAGNKQESNNGSKEEIYTDKFGRVKVKFDWDRSPGRNHKSSCWVRVAHVWAGQQWGAVHIPRVGQEVIAEFLDGDPDRPIITGRVYNKDNMPPYKLPEHRTQSGIKSRSSKGGGPGNFNEIRFEDKKGQEEVHIQAEKNMSTLVKNDQTTTVGHDRSMDVKGQQTTHIGKNAMVTIDGSQSIVIKGDPSVEGVTGEVCEAVSGASLSITNDCKVKVAKNLYVEAGETITFKCGGSSIVLDKNSITVTAGQKAELTLDASATMVSSAGATLTLDDANNAIIKAGKIYLN
jgi:type VI secretion system secreted protein VgrG